MAKLFANRVDLDHMPYSAVSDMGLHCLPMTLLGSPDYNALESVNVGYTLFRNEMVNMLKNLNLSYNIASN